MKMRRKGTLSNFWNWVKFSILIFSLILILIGFSFGYIYNNSVSGACIDRPLSYGIEKINKMNDENFICSCTSNSGKINPFYFNESGVYYGTFLDSQVTIIP